MRALRIWSVGFWGLGGFGAFRVSVVLLIQAEDLFRAFRISEKFGRGLLFRVRLAAALPAPVLR